MTKVLLVEDDRALSLLMQQYLEDEGIDVIIAHSCKEALQLISEDTFSLISLDYNLPDGTAIDILKAANTETPVVILSGSEPNKLKEKINFKNVIDVIEKNVGLEFLKKLREHIK